MTGKVQGYLDTTRQILEKIARRSDCVEITGYDGAQIRWFVDEGIGRALIAYQRDAKRKKAKLRARGL
jgi:hypothetical protein